MNYKNFVSKIQKYLLCFLFLLAGCNTHDKQDKITNLVSIAITPLEVRVHVDEKQQFTAIGTYSDKSIRDLTSSVTWHSSNPQIATIESTTGLTTGIGVGSSQIVANLNNIHSNAVTLNVIPQAEESKEPKIIKIDITAPTSKIFIDQKLQFNAIATYSDDHIRDMTNEVKWMSSDTTVVSISQLSGLATGISRGETQIIASFDSILSNVFSLKIEEAPSTPQITKIDISPQIVEILIGNAHQFNAIATYSDNSYADVTNQVKWKSSNPDIAIINEFNGLVTSVKIGSTEISASLDLTLSNQITLNVIPRILDFRISSNSCKKISSYAYRINFDFLNKDIMNRNYECSISPRIDVTDRSGGQHAYICKAPDGEEPQNGIAKKMTLYGGSESQETFNCDYIPQYQSGSYIYSVNVKCLTPYGDSKEQNINGKCDL